MTRRSKQQQRLAEQFLPQYTFIIVLSVTWASCQTTILGDVVTATTSVSTSEMHASFLSVMQLERMLVEVQTGLQCKESCGSYSIYNGR